MTDQEWQQWRRRFEEWFSKQDEATQDEALLRVMRHLFSLDLPDPDAVAAELRALEWKTHLIDEARIDAAAAKLLDDVEI